MKNTTNNIKQQVKNVCLWFWNAIKNYSASAFTHLFFLFLFGAGFLVIYGFILTRTYDQYHSYSSYEIFQESNHLRYDSLKLQLSNEVDKYIAKVSGNTSALNGLVVVDRCIENDIDICFVLAQGEQESHFGTQGLARKTNSVFNVYAFDGHNYNEINKNGKYNHPNDCVEPYIALLKRDYLVDGKTEYDMLHKFVNKNGARYASATTYEQSLTDKITKIKNNTEIDILYQSLRKQKLILGR